MKIVHNQSWQQEVDERKSGLEHVVPVFDIWTHGDKTEARLS